MVLALSVLALSVEASTKKAKARDPFAVVDANGKAHHAQHHDSHGAAKHDSHGAAKHDDFMKEAEGLIDKLDKDKDKGKGKHGEEDDSLDKLLKELTDEEKDKPMPDNLGMDFDKPMPELTTLANDPRHKLDPLSDPNASAVEDMLGMTKEEREELAKEPRIDTPVDIAIKTCDSETRRLGCKDSQSPIHCLALAVRQQAAEISFECRQATEKSLQYACSVELFTTHCDGVEMPLIPCLDKNHPKLGEECKDALTVTKKVVKSLKKDKSKHAAEQKKDAAKASATIASAQSKNDVVRNQLAAQSSGSYNFMLLFIIAVVVAGLWTKGDDIAPGAKRGIKRLFQREAMSAKVPEISSRHGGSTFDWTGSVDDEKEKSMSNFAALQAKTTSYGGL